MKGLNGVHMLERAPCFPLSWKGINAMVTCPTLFWFWLTSVSASNKNHRLRKSGCSLTRYLGVFSWVQWERSASNLVSSLCPWLKEMSKKRWGIEQGAYKVKSQWLTFAVRTVSLTYRMINKMMALLHT